MAYAMQRDGYNKAGRTLQSTICGAMVAASNIAGAIEAVLIAAHDIAAEARAVAAALVSVIGPQRQALHPMCVRPYHAPGLRRSFAGAASRPAAGGLGRWRP
jgi:hypothetical protein